MTSICPVCLDVVPAEALLTHVRAAHVRDIDQSWTRPVAAGRRRWPANIAKEPCHRCDHYVGLHETVGACSAPGCPCPWPMLRDDGGDRADLAS
jgi:hypothetical protein